MTGSLATFKSSRALIGGGKKDCKFGVKVKNGIIFLLFPREKGFFTVIGPFVTSCLFSSSLPLATFEFTSFVSPLKSSAVGDGSCLTVTELGPSGEMGGGELTALRLPDALPGRGAAASTAAAGGG